MQKKGTALITGGARRVGKAIALALAQHGYNIALHYHQSHNEAQRVCNEIKEVGADCHLFSCNLTEIQSTQQMMQQVFIDCPDCNVLINNASIFKRISFMDSTEETFDSNFSIHVKAPFFLSQAFAKQFRVGNIINLLDTKVHRTLTEYFAYTLSKKTLFEFTKMAAKTLAPHIRVNGIAPGYILPPIDGSETDTDRVQNSIPLQRLGNPDVISQTVLFILENPFLTGECLTVDGGEKLK